MYFSKSYIIRVSFIPHEYINIDMFQDLMHIHNDGRCGSQKNVKASEKLLLSSEKERRENFTSVNIFDTIHSD